MKVSQIYEYLNLVSPFELAENWDNCGLILGAFDDEFETVYCSLDLDLEFVENCEPNSLIITHHPLIFAPLKKINFDNFSTKILKIAIQKNLKLIAMHTNFDKTHLNRFVFEQVLGFKISAEEDFVVYCDVNFDFFELLDDIKRKLNLDFEKFVFDHYDVSRIALTTGSGGSLIKKIKADTFLSGDLKYHEAMEAKALGMNLIEIGHYESEKFFGEILKTQIEQYLKKNNLKDIIQVSQNPFSYRRVN